MGYRDDVIRQAKESGVWELLSKRTQESFENSDDDLFREALVEQDEKELAAFETKTILSQPESSEAEQRATELGIEGLANLSQMLQGKLLEGKKLSQLGRALASFHQAVKESGLIPTEAHLVLAEGGKLSQLGQALDRFHRAVEQAGLVPIKVHHALMRLSMEEVLILRLWGKPE
jgi:hypothetical protein